GIVTTSSTATPEGQDRARFHLDPKFAVAISVPGTDRVSVLPVALTASFIGRCRIERSLLASLLKQSLAVLLIEPLVTSQWFFCVHTSILPNHAFNVKPDPAAGAFGQLDQFVGDPVILVPPVVRLATGHPLEPSPGTLGTGPLVGPARLVAPA